jgi:hypothetical protein
VAIFKVAARKSESRREQHQAGNFGVPGGEQSGQVATHARSHQGRRLPAHDFVNRAELAGNPKMLEISLRQIGNQESGAGALQRLTEKTGLCRKMVRKQSRADRECGSWLAEFPIKAISSQRSALSSP